MWLVQHKNRAPTKKDILNSRHNKHAIWVLWWRRRGSWWWSRQRSTCRSHTPSTQHPTAAWSHSISGLPPKPGGNFRWFPNKVTPPGAVFRGDFKRSSQIWLKSIYLICNQIREFTRMAYSTAEGSEPRFVVSEGRSHLEMKIWSLTNFSGELWSSLYWCTSHPMMSSILWETRMRRKRKKK